MKVFYFTLKDISIHLDAITRWDWDDKISVIYVNSPIIILWIKGDSVARGGVCVPLPDDLSAKISLMGYN